MSLVLKTPPAGFAISRESAKTHMRVVGCVEDALIDEYIQAATDIAETIMQRSIMPQTLSLYLDCWPWDGCVLLRKGPVISVEAITYTDENGDEQDLDTDKYKLGKAGAVRRLVPAFGLTWPTVRQEIEAIQIDYRAGYGDNVPKKVQQAIRVLCATLYDYRSDLQDGAIVQNLPGYTRAYQMLGPHIVRRF